MSLAINNAVSGLNASSLSIANSANNIANVQSTLRSEKGELVKKPFEPQQVVQKSLEPSGGTLASLRPVTPSDVTVFDPDSLAANEEGLTQYPNVSLEQELVGQIFAKNSYYANLKTIEAATKMDDSLLNIIS
jgi:flagellar basal body rod protein FlgC